MSDLKTKKKPEQLKPPMSLESEEIILATCLIFPEKVPDLIEAVRDSFFFSFQNLLVWSAIQQLHDQEQQIDVITVIDLLKRKDQLELAGGLTRISSLDYWLPQTCMIDHHIRKMRDDSISRELIEHNRDLEESLCKGQRIEIALSTVQEKSVELAESLDISADTRPINKGVADVFKSIQERAENPGQTLGVPFGYAEIDKLTSGGIPSNLIILAARPAMGKSTLAFNMAVKQARVEKEKPKEEQRPIFYFSLEMSEQELLERSICMLSGVPAESIKTGELIDEDLPKLFKAVNVLQDMPLQIFDRSSLNPSQMRADIRKMKSRFLNNPCMIYVDYLQLMDSNAEKDTREREIATISRGLKQVAKDLDCCVVALSQLNRSLEKRPDKRPLLSDLRESGAIEQDADIIMFIYRDELYDPDSPHKGKAEVIVSKNRSGPLGVALLACQLHRNRFMDLELYR